MRKEKTNLTLDADTKDLGEKLAKDMNLRSLSQLVEQLIIAEAARHWIPSNLKLIATKDSPALSLLGQAFEQTTSRIDQTLADLQKQIAEMKQRKRK